MDSKSKISIELTVEDCCCIEVWCEKELKCFKPYTRRCTAKVIPDWWNKRVLSLLKRVNPDRKFIGEVDLSKDETYKSIGIGFSFGDTTRRPYHSLLSKIDNSVDLYMSIDDFKGLFLACLSNKDNSSSLKWFSEEYRYFFDNI